MNENHSAEYDWEENVSKYIFLESRHYMIILYATGYGLQFIFSVIGNILLLYILPQIKLSSDYICYAMCALACCDLLIALITMPTNFIITIYLDWFLGGFCCSLLRYFNFVFHFIGIWITVYIAFDRYINICYPVKLFILKTKTFCNIVLCNICLISLLGLFYIFQSLDLKYIKDCNCVQCRFKTENLPTHRLITNVIFQYLLPVILLLFFYAKILKIILKNQKKFSSFFLTNQSEEDNDEIVNNKTTTARFNKKPINPFFVKVSLFFVIFFIISNLPLFSSRIYSYLQKSNQTPASQKYRQFYAIASFLRTMSSSLDPWVYFLYSKKCQKKIKKIFCCGKKSRTSSNYSRSLSFYNINEEAEIIVNENDKNSK